MMDTIFKVAKVMGDVMGMRIRLDWSDRLIHKIYDEQVCQELMQQVNILKV